MKSLFFGLITVFLTLNLAFASSDVATFSGDAFLSGEQGTFSTPVVLKLTKQSENDFYINYVAEASLLDNNGNPIYDSKPVQLLKSQGTLEFYAFFSYQQNCNLRYKFSAKGIEPDFKIGEKVSFGLTELKGCVCGMMCARSYTKNGIANLTVEQAE